MSVRPAEHQPHSDAPRKKVTIRELQALRAARTPITMLTAYDYPTGRACDALGIDITLVGDSLAQVCLGHPPPPTSPSTSSSTTPAPPPAAPAPPPRRRHALRHLRPRPPPRLRPRRGPHPRGRRRPRPTVGAIVGAGIPVVAHGRDAAGALQVLRDALALEAAGAFAVVVEAVPHELGKYHRDRGGPRTHGQVLVWDDVMGTWDGPQPRFARRFADVRGEVERGVRAYAGAVRDGSFPTTQESYKMPAAEWGRFQELAEQFMEELA
ncbi:Pyruvate/Phosphoenolpyruvate kinase-like domain-containing protein [Epithele typhae]|uniref:Pyruvate/Phosphoenolpyruvate kinase-like domain-containing protein n=1 Tax=Epithele typhae TaxID=378194 RepID=UPI0020082078|nr:Pyruvate/Phosphoenolpyruvate kinase-like domain-containing protein [Epithele typhae]KAH9925912.1 Pyruvate/Phosphoenolpyruvate kinase-like domain-containing protein [Epithele typhae]